MNSHSPTPSPPSSPAFPLPPSAPKKRRTLYLFEQDLEDIDRYYSLLYLAAAHSGKRMSFSKTDHLRTAFHAFVNSSIRPELSRLQSSTQSALQPSSDSII